MAFPIARDLIDQESSISGFSMHNPDFIVFNTNTAQALAFGLGRKNREFMFALEEGKEPDEHILTVSKFLESRSAYKRRFIALDKSGAVTYLLQRFQEVSDGWGKMGALPFYREEAEALLKSKPRKGVYSNEWGEEFSREELLDICETDTAAGKLIDKGEAPFRALFSYCDCLSWELNTSDY